MTDLQSKIPAYLTVKRNIIQMVLFTAAFALVFINVYAPFGVNVWFHMTSWQLLFYSSLVILTGVLVVVISRIIMYYHSLKHDISYISYIVWVIAEIIFMSLFYAIYVKYILRDTRYFPDLIKVTIQNTSLVLLLPYSASWLYFSYLDKKIKLEEITQGNVPVDSSRSMLPFNDEKGILRFSVKSENLFYLEAADNYVNIYYLHKEKLARFILRNTLKNLEGSLRNTEIVRCHRSYMVNFDKVKVLRKEKDGLFLELELPSIIDLPVSKTYTDKVLSTFANFSASARE